MKSILVLAICISFLILASGCVTQKEKDSNTRVGLWIKDFNKVDVDRVIHVQWNSSFNFSDVDQTILAELYCSDESYGKEIMKRYSSKIDIDCTQLWLFRESSLKEVNHWLNSVKDLNARTYTFIDYHFECQNERCKDVNASEIKPIAKDEPELFPSFPCDKNQVQEEVTCDCAKNTKTPCMAYCFKCKDVNAFVEPTRRSNNSSELQGFYYDSRTGCEAKTKAEFDSLCKDVNAEYEYPFDLSVDCNGSLGISECEYK